MAAGTALTCQLRRSRTGGVARASTARAFPAGLALPRSQQPAGGYPAIIWVHGGPVSQTRPNFRPDIQMLLAQGFAVLMPNVRGSSGYGRAYTESDDVERRLDSVTDLAHGTALARRASGDRWRAHRHHGPVVRRLHGDVGDHRASRPVARRGELLRHRRFRHAAGRHGPWRRSHRAAEYGDPERDADLFARISPIHRVDRIRVPVLIAHGTRDPRVPIGESEQFVAALQERQKQVTYRTFDYAGHGFIRPDDRRRIYRAVAEFFTAHLR